MESNERINKMEERLNKHIEESNERDISILSSIVELRTTIATLPDIIINKMSERLEEKYVSKEHAKNLISIERDKSNDLYLRNDRAESRWSECYEKHEEKVLDKLSKKVRIWNGVYSLIGTIIGIIIGIIIKFSSFLNMFI